MSYEIAVACDISLGELIKQDPNVTQIDIDPAAVEAVMTDFALPLEPGEVRPLLVVASHFGTIQKWRHKKGIRSGYFRKAQLFESKTPTVKVGVAGNPENYNFTNPDEFINAADYAIKNNYTEKQAVRLLKEVATVEVFEKPKSVQDTIVHELSHAADSYDHSARNDRLKYGLKIIAKYLSVNLGTSGAILAGLNSIYDGNSYSINPVVEGVAKASVALLGGQIAVRYLLKGQHSVYLTAPGEIKAREVEEYSSDYPQIITITQKNNIRTGHI